MSDFQGRNQFGVVDDLKLPPNLLEKLQSHITGAYLSDESASLLIKMLCYVVAPNGMIYVKPNVRKGLLGRLLTELLETRVMVKQAMKRVGADKVRIIVRIRLSG